MAKLETLQDDFDNGVVDPRWTVIGLTPYSETTQLNVTNSVDGREGGMFIMGESGVTYDLTNSFVSINLITMGISPTCGFSIRVTSGGDNITYGISNVDSVLTLTAGSLSGEYVFIPYSEENHQFLRMRESAGTLYFETSPDGIIYTVQGSTLDPDDLTSVTFEIIVAPQRIGVTGNIVQFKYLNHTFTPILPKVKLRGKCKLRGKVKIR